MTMKLKTLATATMFALLAGASAPAAAQVAGGTTIGVSVTVNEAVASGWSARRTILGHKVFGDGPKPVATVSDIIIDPAKSASIIILRVASTLPFAGKLIAIPVDQLKVDGARVVLPGATVENLKATPAFVYAR